MCTKNGLHVCSNGNQQRISNQILLMLTLPHCHVNLCATSGSSINMTLLVSNFTSCFIILRCCNSSDATHLFLILLCSLIRY